ncbi:hypothetical protein LEN26_002613 [Aphanomyces euteiches]|nr:hypothetical protein LEN26_002613 [Aphanomyces euteiches]
MGSAGVRLASNCIFGSYEKCECAFFSAPHGSRELIFRCLLLHACIMTLRASAKRGVKLFDANEFLQTTGKLLGWKVPPPPSTVLPTRVQDIDVTLASDARTKYWNETLRPDPPALPGIMLFDAEDYTKRTGKHLSPKTIFAAECPPRPIEMDFGAGFQSQRSRAPPKTLTSQSFIKIPIAPFDTNIPTPIQPSGGGWKPFFLEKTRPRQKNSCWNFFFPKKACAFPTDIEPRTPTATSFRSTHVARSSQQQRPTEASIFDFLFPRRPIRIKLKASKKQVTIMGDDMPMLGESDDDDDAFDEWWTISTRGRPNKHATIQPHFIT